MATTTIDGGRVASKTQRALAELASGAVFGTALLASGVYAPSIIKAQMTFTSNTMIVVMMGASASSAIIFDIEERFKITCKTLRPPTNLGIFRYDGNVLGGALIGLGMALTSSCAGTSLVQAGTGMAHGGLVIAGGVLGALAFVKAQPHLQNYINRKTPSTSQPSIATEEHQQLLPPKPTSLATTLGINPIILLLIWVPMCLAAIRLVLTQDTGVRQIPAAGLVRPIYGGLLIGFAQLVTTLLARHPLGVSTAYEDIACWLTSYEKEEEKSWASILTSSVIFSLGVLLSAMILSSVLRSYGILSAADAHNSPLSQLGWKEASQAVAGGMVMVFGARLAKGCTSGHGISGLAGFSTSSLITTVAMFTGGVLTARALGY